jgi:hypothetical protein
MSKTRNLFIKGPIPYDWITIATSLGKSPGLVGLGLWFYKGLNNSYTFKIDHKLDDLCSISRQTRQDSLRKLDKAGLIKLTQPLGAYPHIQILLPSELET